MQVQRVHVKLFTDAPEPIPLDPFLDIFARWREEKTDPHGWVDLADYAHVARGPGVMLIGKQGNLSFDLADPGPGILYANKDGLEGPLEERLLETFRRSLALATRLVSEPDYPKGLAPRAGFWELRLNDRLETPNTEENDRKLRPAVESVLEQLLGKGFTAIREPNPARRYGFVIHAEHVTRLDMLSAVVLG